jgi:cell division protein FtsN
MKRMEKERRKHIVNNVLSVPMSTSATTGSGSAGSPSEMLSSPAPHLSAYYSPLPQIDNAAASKLLNFPADLQRQLLEQLNNSMLVSKEDDNKKNERELICYVGTYK